MPGRCFRERLLLFRESLLRLTSPVQEPEEEELVEGEGLGLDPQDPLEEVCLPRLPPTPVPTVEWCAELHPGGSETGEGYFSRAMSYCSRWLPLLAKQKLYSHGLLFPRPQLCPSCSGFRVVINESDGSGRQLHGVPRVERIRTDLLVMGSLSTGRSQSLPEIWSVRSRPLMITLFGSRRERPHWSSRPICSCPESGTP